MTMAAGLDVEALDFTLESIGEIAARELPAALVVISEEPPAALDLAAIQSAQAGVAVDLDTVADHDYGRA